MCNPNTENIIAVIQFSSTFLTLTAALIVPISMIFTGLYYVILNFAYDFTTFLPLQLS